ncbi:hypothetical protein ACLOJK_025852 [Asimina triloba]
MWATIWTAYLGAHAYGVPYSARLSQGFPMRRPDNGARKVQSARGEWVEMDGSIGGLGSSKLLERDLPSTADVEDKTMNDDSPPCRICEM